MNSFTAENYLKAIYKLVEKSDGRVSTTAISDLMETTPASVTDMLKKLAEKKLIHYEKYQGVSLTAAGRKAAISIVRKHRLWKHFLVRKLNFRWDEVHELAEQLEHIRSEELIERLDRFLDYPRSDPHGDPIPDERGNMHAVRSVPLATVKEKEKVIVCGVTDHSTLFLQHIEKLGLSLGKEMAVREKSPYDQSLVVLIKSLKKETRLTHDVARNILVTIKKQGQS